MRQGKDNSWFTRGGKVAGRTDVCSISSQKIHMEYIGFRAEVLTAFQDNGMQQQGRNKQDIPGTCLIFN